MSDFLHWLKEWASLLAPLWSLLLVVVAVVNKYREPITDWLKGLSESIRNTLSRKEPTSVKLVNAYTYGQCWVSSPQCESRGRSSPMRYVDVPGDGRCLVCEACMEHMKMHYVWDVSNPC